MKKINKEKQGGLLYRILDLNVDENLIFDYYINGKKRTKIIKCIKDKND